MKKIDTSFQDPREIAELQRQIHHRPGNLFSLKNYYGALKVNDDVTSKPPKLRTQEIVDPVLPFRLASTLTKDPQGFFHIKHIR